ncbi:MAG TPA: hypothetical protein VKE69_10480 [Planctomycetota bacterium]|nr:hypothetical protein [Planctomycetota bacterium]
MGSLPMISDGGGPTAGSVIYHVQQSPSGSIFVFTPPFPGLVAGYVWLVDGAESGTGTVNPANPWVTVYASDIAEAYAAGAVSVKLYFFGFDGKILGGVVLPH